MAVCGSVSKWTSPACGSLSLFCLAPLLPLLLVMGLCFSIFAFKFLGNGPVLSLTIFLSASLIAYVL